MAPFFPIEDTPAYIQELKRRGFVRVLHDDRGNFSFHGLQYQRERDGVAYRKHVLRGLLQGADDGRFSHLRDVENYAKDHSGVLVEMHRVGLPGKNRVSVWYKLKTTPLEKLTKRLFALKREIRKARNPKRLLDQAGRLIDGKYAAFLQTISLLSHPGSFNFTFDVVSTRREAHAYCRFLIAYRDLWPAGPRNDSGGDHGGKGGPSKKQERRIIARSKIYAIAARESMNYIGENSELAALDGKYRLPPGSVLNFQSEHAGDGISYSEWGNKMAYSETMGGVGTGAAVKKMKAQLRRKR